MELLTRKEASDLLRVHPSTIDRWIANKKLKAHKTGSSQTCKILIEKESIDKLLN